MCELKALTNPPIKQERVLRGGVDWGFSIFEQPTAVFFSGAAMCIQISGTMLLRAAEKQSSSGGSVANRPPYGV